jgi:hypothetical protein
MILRNILGDPIANACISVFGSNYGTPGTGYFSLSTISDYEGKSKRWPYESKDISHIVDEMESSGWSCVVSQDGYGAPVIDCIHLETQEYIDELTEEYKSKFKNSTKGYIRFGKCPKDGFSTNHRDGTLESGVSVFEAEFAGRDYRVIIDSPALECAYVSVMDRPAYRVYGEVIGSGADGEPVLKVSRIRKL